MFSQPEHNMVTLVITHVGLEVDKICGILVANSEHLFFTLCYNYGSHCNHIVLSFLNFKAFENFGALTSPCIAC